MDDREQKIQGLRKQALDKSARIAGEADRELDRASDYADRRRIISRKNASQDAVWEEFDNEVRLLYR